MAVKKAKKGTFVKKGKSPQRKATPKNQKRIAPLKKKTSSKRKEITERVLLPRNSFDEWLKKQKVTKKKANKALVPVNTYDAWLRKQKVTPKEEKVESPDFHVPLGSYEEWIRKQTVEPKEEDGAPKISVPVGSYEEWIRRQVEALRQQGEPIEAAQT